MSNRIGRWIRVGHDPWRRFHYIESEINDQLVTYCGRRLDSTRQERFVDLGSMPDQGIRCSVCERRPVTDPVPPLPDPNVAQPEQEVNHE